MKKIVMITIISMTILVNVFANDTKPIETLESKNEVCILIDKPILQNVKYMIKSHSRSASPDEYGTWTDFRIVADYYRYITKNNKLGLGLGININPFSEFYDIYGSTKIKVPLTNRWFLGVGAGLGNVDISYDEIKISHHDFFKLFTSFSFKNISIYLSYTQDILHGTYNRFKFTKRLSALNLGIGTRL
ncbi:MAG: hypothetical protein LBU10_02360 [Endomicrobium sp.]|jgi:hypothetical protein|nr:hypothetical protein [Endomicrobium sp.]